MLSLCNISSVLICFIFMRVCSRVSFLIPFLYTHSNSNLFQSQLGLFLSSALFGGTLPDGSILYGTAKGESGWLGHTKQSRGGQGFAEAGWEGRRRLRGTPLEGILLTEAMNRDEQWGEKDWKSENFPERKQERRKKKGQERDERGQCRAHRKSPAPRAEDVLLRPTD